MKTAERTLLPGAIADLSTVTFHVADPHDSLRAVRLWQEVRIPGDQLDFVPAAGGWTLTLDRPPVDRMEYHLELTRADGGVETGCDPANPMRARGAFGEKSVLELPGYVPPRWLASDAMPGRYRPLAVTARSLGTEVHGRLWTPDGVPDDRPLPLLVAHDGPEYDDLAYLTSYLAAMVDGGQLPPLRAALLAPGPRDDWYSADGRYAQALALAVLPYLRRTVPTTGVVGMGASLGALAMLHTQRRHPGGIDALFLQSGSFFHPRYDAHERRFPHYDRVVRTVDGVLRADGHGSPVPAVLTYGAVEENAENNRIMARALGAQGYDVTLHELRDAHNFTAWRDAWDPHLTVLLRRAAGRGTPS